MSRDCAIVAHVDDALRAAVEQAALAEGVSTSKLVRRLLHAQLGVPESKTIRKREVEPRIYMGNPGYVEKQKQARKLRAEGLSTAAVARRLGVARCTVSKWTAVCEWDRGERTDLKPAVVTLAPIPAPKLLPGEVPFQ